MKKIGLISDIHGIFGVDVMEFLKDVDIIWHAGDFGNIVTADNILSFKPLIGVYGNIDDAKLRSVYSKYQYFNCEDVSILMTHIGGYPGRYDKDALIKINELHPKIFISGHSHILKVMPDKKHNLLHLNPGACGHYGFHNFRTAIRFVIDGTDIRDLEVAEWKRKK